MIVANVIIGWLLAGDPAIRWHYDVLRGLEYFARTRAPRDIRLQDAIYLLHAKRHKDGRWPVQQK
jgi:hypothetical protein